MYKIFTFYTHYIFIKLIQKLSIKVNLENIVETWRYDFKNCNKNLKLQKEIIRQGNLVF
jgi:hypothetical protein